MLIALVRRMYNINAFFKAFIWENGYVIINEWVK